MRILAVHGIGQYANGTVEAVTARMSAGYTEALGRDVRAVYYAHLLRDPDRQAGADERVTDEEAAILRDWARALGVPEETTMGYPAFPVRLLADWIARRIAGTDDDSTVRGIARMLTNFARDAAAYLNEPDRRAAVRAHVAEAVAADRPDVLIAHSLGSVVAYETLWRYPELRVPLLVTVGSPLAMPGAVFDRLEPPPEPGARGGTGLRPGNAGRWVNLADPGDVVAVPRPLRHYFHGLAAGDDHTASIGALATHGFTKYLRTPKLRACLPPVAAP